MTLKQLEYFCAVAQSRNISQASRQVFVAQPSLSRQISLLEEELGVPLLNRTNRGIELTAAGQRLYQHSLDLFSDIQRIREDIQGSDSGLRGHLSVGSVYSNMPLLTQKLRLFRQMYPEIHIYVRLGSPEELIEDLRQHRLHLLLLRKSGADLSEFNVQTLREDPLELITSRQLDPAPELTEVPLQALRGAPMCMLRADDAWGYGEYLSGRCQQAGFDLNVVCQCYDTPMIMQLVQAGIGSSFQPRSIAQTLQNPGVYAKPVQGLRVASYPCLVWQAGGYVSACIRSFLPLFEAENESGDERHER